MCTSVGEGRSECVTSEDDCLSLSEQDMLSSGRRIWKRPVPILIIDGTHSAFLGTGQAWSPTTMEPPTFIGLSLWTRHWRAWGLPIFLGLPPDLLRGLLTQRTAPSMPRSRGTFRKTRGRKWMLPSRDLWGNTVTGNELLQAPSSQLSGYLGPGSNNLREGQPGTLR